MAALFTPAQELRIRAIAREEATLALGRKVAPGRTSRKPAAAKAASTAKPNPFAEMAATRAAGTLVCTREDHAAGCPGKRGERNAAGRKVFGNANGLAYHMGE